MFLSNSDHVLLQLLNAAYVYKSVLVCQHVHLCGVCVCVSASARPTNDNTPPPPPPAFHLMPPLADPSGSLSKILWPQSGVRRSASLPPPPSPACPAPSCQTYMFVLFEGIPGTLNSWRMGTASPPPQIWLADSWGGVGGVSCSCNLIGHSDYPE